MRLNRLLMPLVLAVTVVCSAEAQDRPIVRRPVRPPPQEETTTAVQPAPERRATAPVGVRTTAVAAILSCDTDGDCESGYCVDGVCCNERCEGHCRSCALAEHMGVCTQVPDGQDPRQSCQIALGGHPACWGACYGGRCAVPDVGTPCGVCAACDGSGRCTAAPTDDDRCGVIDCSGLDTRCRVYSDLTAARCATIGLCKTANDPATCTHYADLSSWVDANGVRRDCKTGEVIR